MNENRFSYATQFALLLSATGICFIISAQVMVLMATQVLNIPFASVSKAVDRPENRDFMRWMSIISSFIAFVLPVYIVSRVISRKPFGVMGFNTTLSNKQLLLVIVLAFSSMILGGALGELNERIPIPANWFAAAKAQEEINKNQMLVLAQMKNISEYIVALLVLAVAPAITEEVLFRSGLQQILVNWTQSKWAGILIASILFSALHISYFGFLPRTVLGVVLGLVFYYSKNIWLSIFMHFLNNAVVVTQLYVMNLKGKPVSKTVDESMPLWWGALAIVVLLVFMRVFRQESEKTLEPQLIHTNSSPENPLS